MKLNPRQRKFAEYYCGEHIGNAEAAMIAAGYSPTYARGNASNLIANNSIQEYIAEINAKTIAKTVATIVEIKTFWTSVMNDEDEMIQHRLRASELLAKASGIFNTDWS